MSLISPHGGELNPRLLADATLQESRQRAVGLQQVRMSSKETGDLIMLATGAFSPLTGFMVRQDYLGVVEQMQYADGTLWPIPVTLAVDKEKADMIREGQEVALVDEEGQEIMGLMEVQERYTYDRRFEAREVFKTDDEAHPGVARIHSQGEVYLGGPVMALSEGRYPKEFPRYARPAEVRRIFNEHGWNTVTAFQTRNPLHRSHEYLVKIALEVSDGVLIHPIVGRLKQGDIPAEVRLRCYEVLLDRYFPKQGVILKVYPMEMRYAGPREAVLHGIIRQNFGCSHLIVGRDHAGVGSYYGPFEAQEIFDQLPQGALQIKPLKLDWTFWCYACGGMASLKTCPHKEEERLLISGTELRKMLAQGRKPPAEFSRPEVLDILLDYYTNHRE